MSAIKLGLSLLILLGLGFCVFVNVVNAPDKSGKDDANRAAAEEIIKGLIAYQAKHGAYPAALADLAPEFMAAVPTRSSGADFSYRALDQGKDFSLAYPEAPLGALPSDAEYEIKGSTGRWEHRVY